MELAADGRVTLELYRTRVLTKQVEVCMVLFARSITCDSEVIQLDGTLDNRKPTYYGNLSHHPLALSFAEVKRIL
ncbi:MAG: hypothetical protein WBD73_07030 [Candidatus Acidiferrales bacterium]